MSIHRTLGIVHDALVDAGLPGGDIDRCLGAVEIALSAPPVIPGLRHMQAKVAMTIAGAHGRVVESGALSDACGSSCDVHGIKTHICHIRKRRPDIGACILTIWGQGYRWDGPPLSEIVAASSPGVDPRCISSLSRAVTDPASVEPKGCAGGDFSGGEE